MLVVRAVGEAEHRVHQVVHGVEDRLGVDVGVAGTAGAVFRLGGVPCGAATPIPALPGFVATALASLLLAGALTWMAQRARRRESALS